MAYDRYDSRRGPRDQSRYPDERYRSGGGERGGREERGFFERAGEQIASWFGDEDDDDPRRPQDRMPPRERGQSGDYEPGQRYGRQPQGWGTPHPSDRDYGRNYSSDRDRDRGSYRPMAGDYGRSEGTSGGFGGGSSGDWGGGGERQGRSDSNWGRDDYRRSSFAGSPERGPERGQAHDPHYHQWRQRQIDELDRDYDEYRREHQSKFENDFGSWRSNRQTKRQMLGQIREHMEVVGNDDEHVGKVDRVAGDRIILTKSDEEAGGAHHSLSCTEIERIEGDRVILATTAVQARTRWRNEDRDRALFEREGQGEAGPHMLDRSFSGTYR